MRTTDIVYIAIIAILLTVDFYVTYLWNPKREPKGDFKGCYEKRLLLTKREWSAYMKLQPALESEGFRICPKVRLFDLIEPKKGAGQRRRQLLQNKIQSKHVDFVICDTEMRARLILELDDSTHDRADRQERDKFVDSILTDCGYQIIRSRDFEKDRALVLTALHPERANMPPDGGSGIQADTDSKSAV